MSALSVLMEDSVMGPVLINCANPIFLCTEPVLLDGADFAFEVFESDSVMLRNRLNKLEQYSLGSGPLFFGALTSLELCDSTSPALALLRDKPTLRGVMRVHKIINLEAGANSVN